jgi:hypothetical protein
MPSTSPWSAWRCKVISNFSVCGFLLAGAARGSTPYRGVDTRELAVAPVCGSLRKGTRELANSTESERCQARGNPARGAILVRGLVCHPRTHPRTEKHSRETRAADCNWQAMPRWEPSAGDGGRVRRGARHGHDRHARRYPVTSHQHKGDLYRDGKPRSLPAIWAARGTEL